MTTCVSSISIKGSTVEVAYQRTEGRANEINISSKSLWHDDAFMLHARSEIIDDCIMKSIFATKFNTRQIS